MSAHTPIVLPDCDALLLALRASASTRVEYADGDPVTAFSAFLNKAMWNLPAWVSVGNGWERTVTLCFLSHLNSRVPEILNSLWEILRLRGYGFAIGTTHVTPGGVTEVEVTIFRDFSMKH